ncbi:MAG TPA: hypothetical protein VFB78_03645 [Acidimicrobiales bacterium]|nr:hypothetical protein [Acidimicrobiales bacterium]
MLTNLLTVVVLGFVGTRLITGVRLLGRPDVRARWWTIVHGLRPRHFAMAPPVLVGVLTTATLLLQVPGLDFGWWTAIGGLGNPVTGGTTATANTPLEWIIPALFLVLLTPALPLFAEAEERVFRQGAEHWSRPRRFRRVVEFGLAHALIGIPIGVALALSVGGAYFMWRYLNGGIAESTRAHLAYNMEVVIIVVIVLIAGAA